MHRIALYCKDLSFPKCQQCLTVQCLGERDSDLDSIYSVFSICMKGETKDSGFNISKSYS